MKKVLFIILLSTGTGVHAQQKTESADPIKGCWVIESNIKSPQKQMVKFYNSDQQLMYEEPYERKILNYSRKRIRRILDSALVTVLYKNGLNEAATLVNIIKLNH